MSLTRSAAPAELPLTIDDLKLHLRLTDTTNDAEVMGYLRAVVDRLDGAEGMLNRPLITQTWIWKFDAFPGNWVNGHRRYYDHVRREAIRLPLPPVQSITSVQYIDTAGVLTTLAASKYKFLNADTPANPGLIEPAFGETWPATRHESEAVTVTFVCGYGLLEDVPEMTRHLIKLLVADAFRQREAVTTASLMATPSMKGLLDLARYHAVA